MRANFMGYFLLVTKHVDGGGKRKITTDSMYVCIYKSRELLWMSYKNTGRKGDEEKDL